MLDVMYLIEGVISVDDLNTQELQFLRLNVIDALAEIDARIAREERCDECYETHGDSADCHSCKSA